MRHSETGVTVMTVPTSDALVLAFPADMHTRVEWTERATQIPYLRIAEKVSLSTSKLLVAVSHLNN